MKQWPNFNKNGDLPPGIYQTTLAEVVAHFGKSTRHRRIVARRLERIYSLAEKTGHLARFLIFGSFVTTKRHPGDIDIFLLMENTFDASQLCRGASKLAKRILFSTISHPKTMREPAFFGYDA